ncbi:MAG: alginate lyase family protein [Nitrospirota bacterium]
MSGIIKGKRLFISNFTAAEKYDRLFPGGRRKMIEHADLICGHVFDLMGSGPKCIDIPDGNEQLIDWQLDFKGGYRWNSNVFRKWISYGSIKGADVIVPWELSRFQDRMALAQAYILSNHSKYAVEFQNQVSDWIRNNRFGFGVNWYCTMDIAIRAANWLVIKELFEIRYEFPVSFLTKFYGSLYDHGRYVRNHLQHFKNVTTNHYVSGLTGLLCIALYCPFFDRSREWLDFAVKELEKEIEKQVYPDGCDYEASTSYHILVLEIFFYALLLGENAGVTFSDSYKARVKKMFEASVYVMKFNGYVPQIGDNDNGRFIKLLKRPVNDHGYLLSVAAVYFRDGNFKLKGRALEEEAYWLYGDEAEKIWNGLPDRDKVESKSFPHAGWYIIRCQDDYCFISCGPNGQGGRGGHAHNDKLSFELVINGQDVIVDPGTYAYTSYPEERNRFRSTGYHNVIQAIGVEQNTISDKKLFGLPDRIEYADMKLQEDDDKISFEGYIKYGNIAHGRTITLNKHSSEWLIEDVFSCPGHTKARLLFHLPPEVTADGGVIYTKEKQNKIASIEVRGHKLEKETYDYSPEYGMKIKSERLFADLLCTSSRVEVITSIIKL